MDTCYRASMSADRRPYDGLTPDTVIDAVEALGYQCDRRILALNSYENRVYQIGIEDAVPIVGKFYRPGRWSNESILEEHEFSLELVDYEIPVVPPLECDGTTLHEFAGYRYAVFPRQGGRRPELEHREDRLRTGRYIGRIHALGRVRAFQHRPTLNAEDFGWKSVDFLTRGEWIPADLFEAYETLSHQLLQRIELILEETGMIPNIRLQGDCYPGNILWNDDGPHFVDFDDCRSGPSIQDLWMLLSGDREEMTGQLADYMEGYSDFSDLDYRELLLIEPLRTLRMMHYAAWLARRWHDPAFPQAFPWFNTVHYWQDHILSLREQLALLEEPPLSV